MLTNGAANMQGKYTGFSSRLSEVAPVQIHVWCYAHVLNLVITDVTSGILESVSFSVCWTHVHHSYAIHICAWTHGVYDVKHKGFHWSEKQDGGQKMLLSQKFSDILQNQEMLFSQLW